jgi:hypothetical protein
MSQSANIDDLEIAENNTNAKFTDWNFKEIDFRNMQSYLRADLLLITLA